MGENMNQLEGGRLYIEGQEWDGSLREIEPAGELPEEAEPLPTVPGSIELTLTPEASEALGIMVQCARETIERIVEAFRKLAGAVRKIWDKIVDTLLRIVNDNPKWWHLYKHAKKYRTRKKYRNRLMQQLRSVLRAVNAQEA